jgi:hypothetical protein
VPISLRRKVFEASAPGYLTTEYLQASVKASRVSWATHFHRRDGLTAKMSHRAAKNLVSQKTLFLRPRLDRFDIYSPSTPNSVPQKTPSLRLFVLSVFICG